MKTRLLVLALSLALPAGTALGCDGFRELPNENEALAAFGFHFQKGGAFSRKSVKARSMDGHCWEDVTWTGKGDYPLHSQKPKGFDYTRVLHVTSFTNPETRGGQSDDRFTIFYMNTEDFTRYASAFRLKGDAMHALSPSGEPHSVHHSTRPVNGIEMHLFSTTWGAEDIRSSAFFTAPARPDLTIWIQGARTGEVTMLADMPMDAALAEVLEMIAEGPEG